MSHPDGLIPRVRRRFREVVAIGCACLTILLGTVTGWVTPLDGILFDLGVWLRWEMGGRQSPESPGVAVIGMDWDSLRAPELQGTPRALFSPVWAQILEGARAGGARLVVYDVVLEFAGNTVLPNHDRTLLMALAKNRGKAVIARTGSTLPAPSFRAAAGPSGLALAEQVADEDGVVRQLTPFFPTETGPVPTLSGAAILAAGRPLPDEPVRYLPQGPLELTIPTYRAIDVIRCAATPEGREVLERAFQNRTVFVGTVLPEEDRKFAPDRFLLERADPVIVPPPAEGCALPRLGLSLPKSRSIPGVHLHAAATSAVVEGGRIHDAPALAIGLIAGTLALVTALVTGHARPALAGGTAVALAGLAIVGSWFAVTRGLHLPPGHPVIAVLGSLPIAFAVRYLMEERRVAKLRSAFGHYLAPVLVDALANAETPPQLGGETREITCMFADLSGFTALSTRLPPDQLMTITNRYLGLIVDAVDRSGGYVDKFIGDCVMALWGAPLEAEDHPARALAAAIEAARAVADERARDKAAGIDGFSIKIGLNTGQATVGNLGARSRFNYSAVGEAVNVAARFESLPGIYDCEVVVSGTTARRVADTWTLLELDQVTVKGVERPLAVFMPLAAAPNAMPDFRAAWDKALRAYRQGDFEQAARLWHGLRPPEGWHEETFAPARVMARRAEALAQDPPAHWDGVWKVAKG